MTEQDDGFGAFMATVMVFMTERRGANFLIIAHNPDVPSLEMYRSTEDLVTLRGMLETGLDGVKMRYFSNQQSQQAKDNEKRENERLAMIDHQGGGKAN